MTKICFSAGFIGTNVTIATIKGSIDLCKINVLYVHRSFYTYVPIKQDDQESNQKCNPVIVRKLRYCLQKISHLCTCICFFVEQRFLGSAEDYINKSIVPSCSVNFFATRRQKLYSYKQDYFSSICITHTG